MRDADIASQLNGAGWLLLSDEEKAWLKAGGTRAALDRIERRGIKPVLTTERWLELTA